MSVEMTQEQLNELERQLSCPSGDNGKEVGKVMNESNIGMTRSAIQHSQFTEDSDVLEIGHGICGHLTELLKLVPNGRYTGIELSETMHQEAKLQNKEAVLEERASFVLYDGAKLPFNDNSFDHVFTVNTIYFWEDPVAFLAEAHRVLKPNGKCVIAFAEKEFMQNLPFVGELFTAYDQASITELVDSTNFTMTSYQQHTDEVKNKVGEEVKRLYAVVALIK
jgi:ubiquinone/menaquinone biosynthesis C-methylase UbiE